MESILVLLYDFLLLFSLPSCVWLFATLWTAAPQTSLSLTISWSLPKFISLHQWCRAAISSSDALFCFCPQSFPASGTFPMSCLFTSDDQNTGASASALVLPVDIQGWSPLKLAGWSLCCPRVFSSTAFQRHQFFGVLTSLWSSYHNHTRPLRRPLLWQYGPLSAE